VVLVDFKRYGEIDLTLPVCSKALCSPGSNASCRYTESLCLGSYCNMHCGLWWNAVVAHDGVPHCSCADFCKGACFTPTCISCQRDQLPLWLRDLPGPLGTGLLCCPFGGTSREPEACCAQGHAKRYGACCELEAPECNCQWGSSVTLQSFNPASVSVAWALLAFAVLSMPALACCRRPLPRSVGPRGAELMLAIAYLAAIIAATVEAKRRWQHSFKPEELMPAGILGTLSTFGLSVVLLPLDRTNTIFALTRIPFERAVKFHRWAGSVAVLLVVAHGILEASVQGFSEMWKFEAKAWGFGNIFGTASGVCCVALALASTDWARRANYRFFPACAQVAGGCCVSCRRAPLLRLPSIGCHVPFASLPG